MALFQGLSGRLLGLTLLVVMAAEVAIFVPSVARFRLDYLTERLVRAELAALTLLAAPDGMVPESMKRLLLERSGTEAITVRRPDGRVQPVAGGPVPLPLVSVDLRDPMALELVADALAGLVAPSGQNRIRVIGAATAAEFTSIEIAVPSEPLRAAMIDYGLRILRLSLVISLATAAVVFIAVRRAVVGPLMRVADNLRAFRENPEDPARVIRPASALGEVAATERALAEMQEDVLRALKERARLASLGQALAKISHDLRNMLAAAQLMADRLEQSADPAVQRALPKLIGSLDRAIRLCQSTLAYGRAEEPPPTRRPVPLRPLIEEVAEGLGLGHGPVTLEIGMPDRLCVDADPEQLYRVLANLIRNAAEAIQGAGGAGRIDVQAERQGANVLIRVADSGPGMPARAVEHLFEPFRGGARRGGSGLGLAIARELVEAHGGRLTLERTGPEGTAFEIRLALAER